MPSPAKPPPARRAARADRSIERQTQISQINLQAWHLRDTDLPRARELGRQAEALAAEDHDHSAQLLNRAYALRTQAYICLRYGEAQPGVALAREACEIFEELAEPTLLLDALDALTGLYAMRGEHAEALAIGQRHLQLASKIDDPAAKIAANNNLAGIDLLTGAAERGHAKLHDNLAASQLLGDHCGEFFALANLAWSCLLAGRVPEARDYGVRALALARQQRRPAFELQSLMLCAQTSLALGEASAGEQLSAVYAQAQQQGNTLSEMDALGSLAQLAAQAGRLEEACQLFETAITLAEQLEFKHYLLQFHQQLAGLFEQRGDDARALAHYKAYHLVDREIYNAETNQRIQQLQAQHEAATARREADAERQRAHELQEHVEEVKAFARMVAHDLKNPLTVIDGYADVLATMIDALSPGELASILAKLQNNSRRANRIIDAMLLLTRVKHQDVPIARIDMAEIMHETRQRLETDLARIGAAVVVPDQWPAALGYAPWVEEVWYNYLNNALKYGGQPPHIIVGGTPLADGMIRFWIRDNGAGLSPGQREQLFVEFKRLHTGDTPGSGLGLAIVRRIVERLGGQAGVESAPGAGCTFFFTLPAASDDYPILI